MVNIKVKSDKHNLDNEKRRRSIKEKQKAKLSQSQIIKQALLSENLNSNSSNKIVFGDEDDGDDDSKKSKGEKNYVLFGDSDGEEETPTIKEKVQFSGKKGFELLNLQSTYGNDERFKIDERFLENEKEDSVAESDENASEKEETKPSGEKKKMLDILGSVLGDSYSIKETAKVKKRQFDMIRYDASKKEHEMYEIKPVSEATSPFKKKKLRKLIEREAGEQSKPEVSKEKFYEVSREIKNSFKEKEEEGQFSLLQTYGGSDIEDDQEVNRYECLEVASQVEVVNKIAKQSRQKVSSEEGNKIAVAQGIWKENFFFEENDPRFKDCLKFINKKNSEEATEAAEKFDQVRRRLKEILRLHMKKQLQKKDPFRNKVGGGNKKQLAKIRPKYKVRASEKKPLKV